jgi:hypothetical protein
MKTADLDGSTEQNNYGRLQTKLEMEKWWTLNKDSSMYQYTVYKYGCIIWDLRLSWR